MKKIQKIIFTLIYTFLVMTAGFAANYTWTGTQSTEWTDYRNWNKNGSPAGPGEKPTTGDDVEIPQTSTKPVITGDAISGSTLNLTINELTLKENAILTLVLKDRDVNFTCTNGITSEDVSTLGAEPGKIRVQHHSTSPGEGSGTKDLAWLVKPSGASGVKIALTEVSSSGYKTRTVTLFNIDSVKDAVIEPSPWAADICVLKLDSDIKISGSLNNKGTTTHNGTFNANGKTVTFNGSSSAIDGTGDISFHHLIVESGKSLTLKGNINISGTFTKNGEFQANNNTTVTFTNLTSTITAPVNSEPTFWNLTIEGSAGLQLGSNIKVAGTFTNNGSFTHNDKTVTFVGYGSKITSTANETEFSTLAIDKREPLMPPSFNHNKLTLTAGTKIKIKIFNNIDKGTFNAENNTEITVTEKFNNPQGKFELGTSTVNLAPPANGTVTITGTGTAGDTAFNNLSLTNAGGKTLKINGKISVNGNLVLQGTNVGSLLTIAGGTGGPGIELNIDKSGGQYLDVKSNIPITGTQTYTTSQSRPENMTSPPANWIFDNCNNTDATPVKWTARASSGHETKWDNRDNWVPKGVPGINTYVKIPSVANSKYPKLESNTYAKAKKVTVEAGTEIDCDEYVISSVNTVSPAPQTNPCSLENYGTLKMKGTGLQNSWFTKITLKTDSTIEYYGTPPSAIDVWAGPYENLKVSGTRQNLRALSITVNKDFTVASASFAQAAGTFIFNGSSTIGGTGTISFNNLTVASSKSVTLNKDITVNGAFINSSGATFNANGKDIIFNGDFTNNSIFTPGSNTVTFNGSSTIGGSGAISFNNLSVASGKSVTLNKDITVNGAFINSNGATFNASTYNITLNGTFSNSGTFNSTDGTNNSFTFNGSFTNSGNFNANADNITFTGTTFTNSGTFTAGTNNTVILTNGADHTITGTGNAGNTKFHNLSLTGAGGKKLVIDKKISVLGDLTLTGTSTDKLTIEGVSTNSSITLTSANSAKGQFLKVRTNIPITGGTYKTLNSFPYALLGDLEIGDGNPEGWIFEGYAGPMTWKGNYSSNWSDWQNWRPYGTPGVNSDVTIPQKEAAAHYPKLTANVSAKSVTVNSEAELDLDGQIIKKGTGSNDFTPLTNNGTLKMTGTSSASDPKGQKEWFENATITFTDNSTVEYYGNTPATSNIWAGPYENLKVSGGKTSFTTGNLIVNKAFTVDTTGSFTINAGSQNYKGAVELKKETTFKSDLPSGTIFENNLNTFGNSITFDGNGEIKTRDIMLALGSGTITVKEGTGGWTSAGQITVKDIIVKRNWISSSHITASGDITADNTAHTNIWTSNFGDIKLTGNLTAAQFNQTAGTLTFNGTGTPEQELKFTGAGNKNIKNLAINSSAKVKLGSNITIQGNFTNSGTFDATTAPGYTITLTNGADHTITGTGTASATTFRNLSLTGAGGKKLTINGKISVNGNLTLQGSGAADTQLLTIAGGTSSPGIKLSADQTGNGKWLNVHTNVPMTPETGGKTYTVTESKAHEVPGFLISDGHPKNWIFNDYIGEMKWSAKEENNTDKTKWDKPKNWIPNGIPGTHTKVNIPTGINKYPKLESSTNAKAEKITLNGELDLAGYVITDTLNTAPLTNNGLLKMTGTADQKTWFENSSSNDKITLGDNSTVQYDSGSSANVFSGPYENLILNRSITAASSLTVNKKTTVNAAATITAPAQTYGGDVRINANTTFSAINSITFSHAIGASANNVTFDGNGTINTQKLSAADITVNSGTGAWTSSGSVTADNINTQRDWISSDDVTAAGNITSNNAWTASSGNIALKGNLSANQFTQTGGTLIFNGNGTPQTLLFTNPAGQKNIYNLIIDTGATLELRSDITIKRDFTNKGTFNADTHTVTLTNDADHKIIGTNTAGDTKFYNLFCEDAGDKTLTFENEIWVEEKMYLSGSYSTGIKPLNIDGNGVISLNNNHPIPGNVSITNIRQKFLRVFSNKVKIGNNKYYGTDESTDDQGTTKNNNGWVFYKTFELVNSFAIPGKNEIYLLFKNGSANNVYTELTEADLANPNFTPLIITDGSSHVYAENRLYIPERLPLPSAIKEHTFWKFTLNNSISPDWILNQNALISLDYYDRKKQKLHISDIGIDMITPQRASNSIVLRSFDASEDDKALPRLDVTILAEKKGTSNNAQLYFYSKDSAEHKLWHPGTVPIGPPPRFAVPQAGTTNYGCTLENNLLKSIISEQDVHLEPNKVGGFMYIYDGWLPCARLRNSNDILSFDVWHFKIVGVQKQKGGVSIFDNVLDPYKGQETIIAAHLQKPGMLTIQIMSIDGSIIRTIERSYKAAGDHIYFWDGKNNGGNPVARGIYFVRIAGPDIDEIRKILVVKN